jgi:hypothetical protein
VLPNSKLTVQYSTKYFKLSDEDLPTFEPDIKTELSFSAFMSCGDPALERILDYDPDPRGQ